MDLANGEPTREDLNEWIKRRTGGFNDDFVNARDLSAKIGDEALRFLGLAQLGGIAGCLGFVGALKQSSPAIGLALAMFVFGTVCLFFAHLLRFRAITKVGRFIHDQADAFTENPTPEFSRELYALSKARDAAFVDHSLHAALASALFFVLGSVAAAVAALTISPPPQPTPDARAEVALSKSVPGASAPVAASRPAVEKNTGSNPTR